MASQEQLDEDMQDALEAELPEDSVEMRDVALLQVTAPSPVDTAGDDREIIKKLSERLSNVGINPSRTRLPLKTDADYEINSRDTFEFLSIVVGAARPDQLHYEVLRKFRMGSRVIHPDKTLHFEDNVRTWANRMMNYLSHAKEEALMRLSRMNSQSHVGKDYVMQDYLEFNEQFQQVVINTFKPNLVVMSTSDLRYITVCPNKSSMKVLEPSEGRAFYHRLYDFQSEPKQALSALFCDAMGSGTVNGSTVVLAFTRTPNEFPAWLQKQLIDIRSAGLTLYLVILLVCPALPCTWKQLKILTGSPFDATCFDTLDCKKHSFRQMPSQWSLQAHPQEGSSRRSGPSRSSQVMCPQSLTMSMCLGGAWGCKHSKRRTV